MVYYIPSLRILVISTDAEVFPDIVIQVQRKVNLVEGIPIEAGIIVSDKSGMW